MPLLGSLQNVLSVFVGPVRACVRVYPLPRLHSMWLLGFSCVLIVDSVSYVIYITSPPLFLCLRLLWRVVGCFVHETWWYLPTVDDIIRGNMWYTGFNPVISEPLIVVFLFTQCWNGSVIWGPVCAVLPVAFNVVCNDMCPCLHVHLATVMTAVVLLLKTFISLPTYYYYYYYFHVLLGCIASPPLLFWFLRL